MENLTITSSKTDSYELLKVTGTVNSYTYVEFEKRIYSAVKNNDVVLDLSQVSNLSSSGLGVLMSANEDGEENGNNIYILKPSEVVKLAIDSTGFSDMFNFIHSVDEIKK